MKLLWPICWGRFALGFTLGLTLNNFAQTSTGGATNTDIPAVTILATDPTASWSGDTGTFTVFRRGNPAPDLNVYYRILGTASNGVDYQTIGNYVALPSGTFSNSIVITPLGSSQAAIKTVTLELGPAPTMQPINYTIGYPSNATVFITPKTNNLPPRVDLVSPTNGSVFYTPVDITLVAFASDPDGTVTGVEFFAGTNSLGLVTNGIVVDPVLGRPLPPPGTRAFLLSWTSVPVGSYALTAVATDDSGASTTSAPVGITVQPGPPTNLPPVVRIAAPTNGSVFYTPVDIPICATASDPDGYVATVEFFANDASLGIRTNNPLSAGPANPFCLLWSNAPPGRYALTAKATDNGGATTTSDPVNIQVQPGPPPPPTNLPPLVRITSPPNGAVFRAPVNLPLYAYANDLDGYVTRVEFFADGTSVGEGHPIGPIGVMPLPAGSPSPGPIPPITISNIWVLIWSNAPPGTNIALTAVASDNGGASNTSAPVTISILAPLPPPTNRPPIVSIVASDPIAIEGTNCWPWLGLAGAAPTWANWTAATAVCRFFTNCGPKDAIFTVRRVGDTNGDLTVTYAVGGTATNGIDYVPLPGVAVIPAGQRQTQITVVPIDDGPPDITSTVVLKLLPSASTPPDYVLGYPRSAAALILDGPFPRPIPVLLPDKCFHLGATGPDGAWFHVEVSSDLVNWTPICTNQVINGTIDFVDPDAAGTPSRYYRALPEAGPPQ